MGKKKKRRWTASNLTGGPKLRVEPFRHDALQAQTGAHERDADEGQRVRQDGETVDRHAGLPAFPYRDGGCHGKQGLRECAAYQPESGTGPNAVSNPAQRGTGVERDERGQRLLINAAEDGITTSQHASEDTRDGDGQL